MGWGVCVGGGGVREMGREVNETGEVESLYLNYFQQHTC